MELQNHLPEKGLLMNLTAAAASMQNGKLDLTLINKVEINQELRKFKDDRGVIKFKELFDLPQENRIYKWAEDDIVKTISMVSVYITLAMESFNLNRRMNDSQIADLAQIIVEESIDTKKAEGLSFEDLGLFLQKLTRGEYPDLYEGIDQVKFLTRFNSYRDERREAYWKMKDEEHEEFKRMGDDDSYERRHRKDTSPFGEYLQSYSNRIQQKNDEIARLREEQKRNRQ